MYRGNYICIYIYFFARFLSMLPEKLGLWKLTITIYDEYHGQC